MSETNYYMTILSTLSKKKLDNIKKELKNKVENSQKYNSVMEGYFKNKEYQNETIKIMKEHYETFVKPYRDMRTQNYSPTQIEKTIIKITDQSYKIPSDRKNIDSFEYLEKLSNQKVAVYQYKTLWIHKIVVAFRGSKDKEDLIPDFYIMKNRHSLSNRFEKSLTKCDKIYEMFPNAKIYVTGHSLGGTLSIWVRQHRDYCQQCYAFSPGYNGIYKPRLNLKYKNLKIMMVKGDVICNTLISINRDYLPDPKNLVILSGKENAPIQNHKFVNYMKLV